MPRNPDRDEIRRIELARGIYVTNDERADARKRLHMNSTIVEEKSYQGYKRPGFALADRVPK